MKSLIMILREVPDRQTGNPTRHGLLDMLVITLIAMIFG